MKKFANIFCGSYITGGSNIKANPNNPLFQHEYGHYLQSQKSGPLYLLKYGAASATDADWTEWDANQRAANYFQDKFTWASSSNSYRFLPGYTTNPRWFEYPLLINPLGIFFILSKNRTNPW